MMMFKGKQAITSILWVTQTNSAEQTEITIPSPRDLNKQKQQPTSSLTWSSSLIQPLTFTALLEAIINLCKNKARCNCRLRPRWVSLKRKWSWSLEQLMARVTWYWIRPLGRCRQVDKWIVQVLKLQMRLQHQTLQDYQSLHRQRVFLQIQLDKLLLRLFLTNLQRLEGLKRENPLVFQV
jgi:hypothetical protein